MFIIIRSIEYLTYLNTLKTNNNEKSQSNICLHKLENKWKFQPFHLKDKLPLGQKDFPSKTGGMQYIACPTTTKLIFNLIWPIVFCTSIANMNAYRVNSPLFQCSLRNSTLLVGCIYNLYCVRFTPSCRLTVDWLYAYCLIVITAVPF